MDKTFSNFPIELTQSDRTTMKNLAKHTLQEMLDDIEQIGVRFAPNSSGKREASVYMTKESQAVVDAIQAEIESFRERLLILADESIDPSDVSARPL